MVGRRVEFTVLTSVVCLAIVVDDRKVSRPAAEVERRVGEMRYNQRLTLLTYGMRREGSTALDNVDRHTGQIRPGAGIFRGQVGIPDGSETPSIGLDVSRDGASGSGGLQLRMRRRISVDDVDDDSVVGGGGGDQQRDRQVFSTDFRPMHRSLKGGNDDDRDQQGRCRASTVCAVEPVGGQAAVLVLELVQSADPSHRQLTRTLDSVLKRRHPPATAEYHMQRVAMASLYRKMLAMISRRCYIWLRVTAGENLPGWQSCMPLRHGDPSGVLLESRETTPSEPVVCPARLRLHRAERTPQRGLVDLVDKLVHAGRCELRFDHGSILRANPLLS
nr:hypothetical protein CFP56_20426 [Quercus suber]